MRTHACSLALGTADNREALLAAHGLDEDRWQAIDDAWQARLSAATDAITDEEPIPPFLAEYSAAMERARDREPEPMSFDRYIEATLRMRRGGDIVQELKQIGLTTDEYLRANRYWIQRMAKDGELSARFQAALD